MEIIIFKVGTPAQYIYVLKIKSCAEFILKNFFFMSDLIYLLLLEPLTLYTLNFQGTITCVC